MQHSHQLSFDRIKHRVSGAYAQPLVSEWICTNTRHPKRPETEAWNFFNHEMQVAIADDPAPWRIARKCSQMGLSELAIRILIAMLLMRGHTTWIYTLQNAGYASKFMTTRLNPMIADSPVVASQLNRKVDSSTLKQIGTSFLHMLGASTESQAISIPADGLFRDEVDFSNQKVLSMFESRLGHEDVGEQKLKIDFSTPTVNNYGISASFDLGSQNYFSVLHKACNHRVIIRFPEDIVVPGFEEDIWKWDKYALNDPKVDVTKAHIRCPHCKQEVSHENMAEAATREWVPMFPDRKKDISSYQIYPTDAIILNPVVDVLHRVENYKAVSDFWNFEVGTVFEDDSNSVVESNLQWVNDPVEYESGICLPTHTVAGIDVGKTCNVTIGVPGREGTQDTLKIICALERKFSVDKLTGQSQLIEDLAKILKWFRCSMVVIDSAPDFSTANGVAVKMGESRGYVAAYSRAKSIGQEIFTIREDLIQVNVRRTASLDDTVRGLNKGRITLPAYKPSQDHEPGRREIMSAHLSNVKKVYPEGRENEGVWVDNGPDHYLHSLNYCNIAAKVLQSNGIGNDTSVAPVTMKVTRMPT